MRLFTRQIIAFCFLFAVSFGFASAATNYVRFDTNLGSFDVQLLPGDAPHTVQNFLAYVTSGSYTDSVIDRSVPGFVIQGGGYGLLSGSLNPITAGAPIVNEFKDSNVRGTLAMAKQDGEPDSATSAWFFNEVNNSANLDHQNGGFTVFGRVANNAGLAIMDAIAAVPVPNPSPFAPPLDSIPLINYNSALGPQISNLVLISQIVPESAPTAPTITSISPTSAKVGDKVVITGTGFVGPLSVSVGGASVTEGSFKSTAITIVVPAGAASGQVIVNTPNGGIIAPLPFTLSTGTNVPAKVTFNNLGGTYNGLPQAASAVTDPPNLPLTILYNGSATPPTDAGTYTVVATVTGGINSETYVGSATGKFVIAPAAPTGMAPSSIAGDAFTEKVTLNGQPYPMGSSFYFVASASDDTYAVIPISGSVTADMGTFSYSASQTGTTRGTVSYQNSVSTEVPPPSNAISVANTLTFQTSSTGTFLAQNELGIPANFGTFALNNGVSAGSLAGWSIQFNATTGAAPFALKGAIKLSTGATGTTYQIAAGSASAASSGTYAYSRPSSTASSFILTDGTSGAVDTYTLSWTSTTTGIYFVHDSGTGWQGGTFTATPAATTPITGMLTATGTLQQTFTYTIQDTGPVATYTATGLPAGLTVDSSTGVISGVPAAAGTFNVKLDADNGSSAGATLVLTIDKAAATVTSGGLTVGYTGKAVGAAFTTEPPGLNLTYVYTQNGKTVTPLAIGSYGVTATINDDDYMGSATGTLVVTTGTATYSLTKLSLPYTGKPLAPTVMTSPAGLPTHITYTATGTSTNPTLVGSYPFTVTQTNPDYTGSTTGTFVIGAVKPAATITTTPPASIEAEAAELYGTVDTKGDATTAYFKWGTTTSYGQTTGTQTLTASVALQQVQASISGLQPKTVYHYQLVATNSAGTTSSADHTLTTTGLQSVDPQNVASSVSATGATLSEGVTPSGMATTAYFQFGTSQVFGAQTATQTLGSGATEITAYGLISGLAPNTTYYYQLVTHSTGGTFYGPIESFTTAAFDTSLVAQSGDIVAAGSTLGAIGNPALGNSGAVAFLSSIASGTTSTPAPLGIFVSLSGSSLQAVAETGENGSFSALSDPVVDDSGRVGFAGTSDLPGLWVWDNGSLTLEVQQGDAAPDVAGSTFASFSKMVLLNNPAGPMFVGALTPNASQNITASNNLGIFVGGGGQFTELLRQGQTIDGSVLSQFNFLPNVPVVGGQSREFTTKANDIVLNATFTDKSTAIIDNFDSVHVLVRSGAAATGLGSGVTYASFGPPAENDNLHVAFAAMLAGTGITSANNVGIWADNSSSVRQLVAQTGATVAPDVGGSLLFASLSDPAYNNNEAVAFLGTLKGVPAASATGVWCNSANGLHLVARQGGNAPDCPGATFAGFSQIALPDQGGATHQGGVVMLATLNVSPTAGVTTANNTGIWAVDSSGALQLIVRTGDVLPDRAGVFKTVTGVTFLPNETVVNGQTRSFDQSSGDLVYLATFSDKSTAVYSVEFP